LRKFFNVSQSSPVQLGRIFSDKSVIADQATQANGKRSGCMRSRAGLEVSFALRLGIDINTPP